MNIRAERMQKNIRAERMQKLLRIFDTARHSGCFLGGAIAEALCDLHDRIDELAAPMPDPAHKPAGVNIPVSWAVVFNSDQRHWGFVERARSAAKLAGYKWFAWNGWVYSTGAECMADAVCKTTELR